MSLSAKIRRLREQKGFSQIEIAYQLDVSQSAYNKWESGQTKPTLNHLKKIAEIFEVDFFDLIKEQMQGIDLSNANCENSPYMINPMESIINFQSKELTDKILENQLKIASLIEKQNKLFEDLLKNK